MKLKGLATIVACLVSGAGANGTIAPRMSALGGPICVGDRVMNFDRGAGTVVEVSAQGPALVQFDRWTAPLYCPIDSLGKGVRCHNGFCENNRVVDPDLGAGMVVEIFNNGIAVVQFDLWPAQFRMLANLRIDAQCQKCSP